MHTAVVVPFRVVNPGSGQISGSRPAQGDLIKIAEYLSKAAQNINDAYALLSVVTDLSTTPLEEASMPESAAAPSGHLDRSNLG